MVSPYNFGIRVFDCSIRVETDCVESYRVLQGYIFPSFSRTADALCEADVTVRVVRAGDQLQLFADEVLVASASRARDLVPDVIRVLDDAVVPRLATLRAVHAGAVLLGQRVLLLPGRTHAGKSSLVTELIRRGATYFSDEYALIDPDGLVHPYARALLVRNGTPEQVPMLHGEFVGERPAAVGWILSLQYLPGSTWGLEAMSQSEALLLLLRNTPHLLEEKPDMVGVFEGAVARAACYAGVRDEADEAVDQILRLVERSLSLLKVGGSPR